MQTSSERRLAIEAVGLSKHYRLGELPSAREVLRRPRRDAASSRAVLTVLDSLDLAVQEGDCLGVLGTNGSGKSTFVNMVAGITVPTAGVLRVRGRVLPLLEVGAGFNDELTGRENVVLFGTILGLSPREIASAMPDIAAFGGIDELHLDTPLKRYSTGMRARLSFSVAIRFPADIYIFDEVVAVVDDQFRDRALDEIQALTSLGRTVVFISHDLDVVRQVCTSALWLNRGRVEASGPVAVVADAYAEFRAADDPAESGGKSELTESSTADGTSRT